MAYQGATFTRTSAGADLQAFTLKTRETCQLTSTASVALLPAGLRTCHRWFNTGGLSLRTFQSEYAVQISTGNIRNDFNVCKFFKSRRHRSAIRPAFPKSGTLCQVPETSSLDASVFKRDFLKYRFYKIFTPFNSYFFHDLVLRFIYLLSFRLSVY